MSEHFVRVSVRMPLQRGEEARALALDLSPGGFEESDDGETLTLSLYVAEAAIASIEEVFSDVEVTPVEPGWEDAWRASTRCTRSTRSSRIASS